jgi:hypothetical protein
MLPHWIGIPGVFLLIAFIAYAWRQGTRVQSRGEGSSSDAGIYPPSDSDSSTHHGW